MLIQPAASFWEVLQPTQALPTEMLPQLTEVSAGTLTLVGAGDHVRFFATAFTVFGFVTVPVGLGFGLCIAGFDGWLKLGTSWRRLRNDGEYRSRHEATLAAMMPPNSSKDRSCSRATFSMRCQMTSKRSMRGWLLENMRP